MLEPAAWGCPVKQRHGCGAIVKPNEVLEVLTDVLSFMRIAV